MKTRTKIKRERECSYANNCVIELVIPWQNDHTPNQHNTTDIVADSLMITLDTPTCWFDACHQYFSSPLPLQSKL